MGSDGPSPESSPPPGIRLSSSLPSPTTSREDAAAETRHTIPPSLSGTDNDDGFGNYGGKIGTARGRLEQQGSRLGVGVSDVTPTRTGGLVA